MKVLMFCMPVHHSSEVGSMKMMPTTAIYQLGAIVRNSGYDIEIIEQAAIRKFVPLEDNYESFTSFLEDIIENVDVIAMSSNTLNWSMCLEVANYIRKINANMQIIMGGLHPTYFHEYIIKNTPANYVLRGEGEESLVELLEAIQGIRQFNDIRGLTWIDNDDVIINADRPFLCGSYCHKIPLPAFDLLPRLEYPVMPITTSLGCKFACRFCSIPRKSNWVGFDPDWVVQRVIQMVDNFSDKFSTNDIYFTDDCFTADVDRAIYILSEVLKKRNDISITIEARANDLRNGKLLELLSHPQIGRVAIGVESGYNEGLKKVKKGLTIEQLEETMEYLVKYNIISRAYFSFIIGFPWESVNDCLKTIDYVASIVKRFGYIASVNWLKLFPSQIWEERHLYGIDVEPNIFDDHRYGGDMKSFFITHPYLNRSTCDYLNKYMVDLEDRGICVQSP